MAWTEQKSKVLFKLFKEWLDNEFDTEVLAMTRNMIQQRETVVKKAMDIYNKKQVKGFRPDK